MAKLRISGVSHRFGDLLAIDDLSLEVGEGEIVCLLGPSGCGKTTTLRLAAGLEPLQAGRIEMDDRVVATPGRALAPEERRVGMVFQDYALFPHLSVAANVGFGLAHLPAAARLKQVRRMLERVDLARRADDYPHQLSGGEQQRVALARALAPEPALMLMDEPFANLDVTLRNAVRDETLSLLKGVGATVLLVTHDPEEAMRMADRIAVLRGGRLVQAGPAHEVYLKPADPFMARFFGAVNELAGEARDGMVETPLGPVANTAGLPDGPVSVLVRPEGLAFADRGADLLIDDIRLVGAYWRIRMSGPGVGELKARMIARPPAAGSRVKVTLDPDRVILFPLAVDDL